MPTIPIGDPGPFTIPPSTGFVPDRLGVRRFAVDIDRVTEVISASFTPCPATAEVWGPVDAAEVMSGNLVADLMAAPDSAEKLATLQALQRVQAVMEADLPIVAGFLLSLRG